MLDIRKNERRKYWDEKTDGDIQEIVEWVPSKNRKYDSITCCRKSCNPTRWYGQGRDHSKSQTWTSSFLGLANWGVGVEINW